MADPIKPGQRWYETLTAGEVKDIRERKAKGQSNRQIAKFYNVDSHTMDAAVRAIMEPEKPLQKFSADSVMEYRRLMNVPGAKAAMEKFARQHNVTPQEAASHWLSVLDRFTSAAVENLEFRHDPKYNGMPELGFVGVSDDPTIPVSRKSDWVRSAAAEAEYSMRDVMQMVMLQAKLHMEMMPYFHAKVASVEPKQSLSELENLSPEERRARLRTLIEEAGLNDRQQQH